MLPILNQSLLICYLILGFFHPDIPPNLKSGTKHPLHLSSAELNCNAKTGTVEISCRIFTDDFEDLLGKKYKVKPDLSAAAKHKEMDLLVHQYMDSHLLLSANGQALQLNYLGFENDSEAVIVYLESAKVKQLKKLQITSTVLYDQFDDQTNIFHITFKGNRKSSKLTYPDKTLVSGF